MLLVIGPSKVGKSSGLEYWATRNPDGGSVVDLDACFTPTNLCSVQAECRPVLDDLANRPGVLIVDVGAGTQNSGWFWEWVDRRDDITLVTVWAPPDEVFLRNDAFLRGARTFEDFVATEYGPHRQLDRGHRVDVSGLDHEERVACIASAISTFLDG